MMRACTVLGEDLGSIPRLSLNPVSDVPKHVPTPVQQACTWYTDNRCLCRPNTRNMR